MSQAPVAAASERLPWLEEEPAPERGNLRELAGWALAVAFLALGAGVWMKAQSLAPSPVQSPGPSTTVALPRPSEEVPPQPQVALEPPPEVRPSPQRELPTARPPDERRVNAPRDLPEGSNDVAPAPAQAPAPAPAVSALPRPLSLWPAWQSQGALGRIVRIGAFGSRAQAKLGWRYMVRSYPAVAHLPATVVESSNSRGHAFYRFQIGTTSQAHSEVLCQRMEKISLSCAVVGLPWKPKGVER